MQKMMEQIEQPVRLLILLASFLPYSLQFRKFFLKFCVNVLTFIYRLGERQIINLTKIAAFCRDTNLFEERQADIRRKCLAYWEIPDTARKADTTVAEELFERIMKKCGGKGNSSR